MFLKLNYLNIYFINIQLFKVQVKTKKIFIVCFNSTLNSNCCKKTMYDCFSYIRSIVSITNWKEKVASWRVGCIEHYIQHLRGHGCFWTMARSNLSQHDMLCNIL